MITRQCPASKVKAQAGWFSYIAQAIMQGMPELYDIIVIGGGFSGLGVALEASKHGYRCLLIEKERCCSKTSANSLRIVHGGFRYLQNLNLKRVIESVKEQGYWLTEAPNHVEALPCALPLRRHGFKSRLPISIASSFYEVLTGYCVKRPNGSRVISGDELGALIAVLTGRAGSGALIWNDALLKDVDPFARFLSQRIEGSGGEILELTRAESVTTARNGFLVHCVTTGGGQEFAAKVVVNALGPWLNRLNTDGLQGSEKRPKGWCKAFNVVLNRQLEVRHAFGLTTRSGRVLFFVPRGDRTVVGTWYTPFDGDPEYCVPDPCEIEQLLSACSEAMPGELFHPSDVTAVDAGVMPMRGLGSDGPLLYGSHQIHTRMPGYLEILSTKFTTFRSQGADVLRLAKAFLGSNGGRG